MATKVKPSRLQVTGTPQAGCVPVYVSEDCFCRGAGGGGDVSDAAYSSCWDGDTTHAPSKNAMYDKIETITEVIPSEATCSNQLADKNYVNDGINSVTAYYITKNAQGDQFACYAELASASTFYSGGVQRTPTRNDYTIVADDECYSDATTRYIYNSGWEYQYTVNETPLTTAQLNALNSGITSAKVSCYDCCMAQCCDIPTDNCQLCNGCGYTTCTGTLTDSSLVTVNGCCLVGSGDITISGGSSIEAYTQAEYNDLPASKDTDGVWRLIYK